MSRRRSLSESFMRLQSFARVMGWERWDGGGKMRVWARRRRFEWELGSFSSSDQRSSESDCAFELANDSSSSCPS